MSGYRSAIPYLSPMTPQALGVRIHDGERSDVGMCLIQGQERFSEAEPDDRDPERTVHGHALRFRTCGQ